MPLYLVVFTGFVGYSLMITVFTPLLLDDQGGLLPESASPSERTLVLGALLALYPLAQFVGSPILGALSDRFGRRPALLRSLLAGLSEANIAIAQSAIADVAAAAERSRLFGYVYLSSSLAYVVGPLAGGKLADPGADRCPLPRDPRALDRRADRDRPRLRQRRRRLHAGPAAATVPRQLRPLPGDLRLLSPIVVANLGLVAFLSRRLDPRR